jgi:hypothetical protein
MMSVIRLSDYLNVTLSVVRLNVDMLSVVAPSMQPMIEGDILALTTVGVIEIII